MCDDDDFYGGGRKTITPNYRSAALDGMEKINYVLEAGLEASRHSADDIEEIFGGAVVDDAKVSGKTKKNRRKNSHQDSRAQKEKKKGHRNKSSQDTNDPDAGKQKREMEKRPVAKEKRKGHKHKKPIGAVPDDDLDDLAALSEGIRKRNSQESGDSPVGSAKEKEKKKGHRKKNSQDSSAPPQGTPPTAQEKKKVHRKKNSQDSSAPPQGTPPTVKEKKKAHRKKNSQDSGGNSPGKEKEKEKEKEQRKGHRKKYSHDVSDPPPCGPPTVKEKKKVHRKKNSHETVAKEKRPETAPKEKRPETAAKEKRPVAKEKRRGHKHKKPLGAVPDDDLDDLAALSGIADLKPPPDPEHDLDDSAGFSDVVDFKPPAALDIFDDLEPHSGGDDIMYFDDGLDRERAASDALPTRAPLFPAATTSPQTMEWTSDALPASMSEAAEVPVQAQAQAEASPPPPKALPQQVVTTSTAPIFSPIPGGEFVSEPSFAPLPDAPPATATAPTFSPVPPDMSHPSSSVGGGAGVGVPLPFGTMPPHGTMPPGMTPAFSPATAAQNFNFGGGPSQPYDAFVSPVTHGTLQHHGNMALTLFVPGTDGSMHPIPPGMQPYPGSPVFTFDIHRNAFVAYTGLSHSGPSLFPENSHVMAPSLNPELVSDNLKKSRSAMESPLKTRQKKTRRHERSLSYTGGERREREHRHRETRADKKGRSEHRESKSDKRVSGEKREKVKKEREKVKKEKYWRPTAPPRGHVDKPSKAQVTKWSSKKKLAQEEKLLVTVYNCHIFRGHSAVPTELFVGRQRLCFCALENKTVRVHRVQYSNVHFITIGKVTREGSIPATDEGDARSANCIIVLERVGKEIKVCQEEAAFGMLCTPALSCRKIKSDLILRRSTAQSV